MKLIVCLYKGLFRSYDKDNTLYFYTFILFRTQNIVLPFPRKISWSAIKRSAFPVCKCKLKSTPSPCQLVPYLFNFDYNPKHENETI